MGIKKKPKKIEECKTIEELALAVKHEKRKRKKKRTTIIKINK